MCSVAVLSLNWPLSEYWCDLSLRMLVTMYTWATNNIQYYFGIFKDIYVYNIYASGLFVAESKETFLMLISLTSYSIWLWTTFFLKLSSWTPLAPVCPGRPLSLLTSKLGLLWLFSFFFTKSCRTGIIFTLMHPSSIYLLMTASLGPSSQIFPSLISLWSWSLTIWTVIRCVFYTLF